MLSDEWLPRYRLLENFTIKWNGNGNAHGNGNGNAYDRGDYNSSFALRAVELKMSSFKSIKNIQKKEGGPDRSALNNQCSLVTLNELAMKARESIV